MHSGSQHTRMVECKNKRAESATKKAVQETLLTLVKKTQVAHLALQVVHVCVLVRVCELGALGCVGRVG